MLASAGGTWQEDGPVLGGIDDSGCITSCPPLSAKLCDEDEDSSCTAQHLIPSSIMSPAASCHRTLHEAQTRVEGIFWTSASPVVSFSSLRKVVDLLLTTIPTLRAMQAYHIILSMCDQLITQKYFILVPCGPESTSDATIVGQPSEGHQARSRGGRWRHGRGS